MAILYFCHCSSEYFKTDIHQPVSACLACFEAIWQNLISDLLFSVHLQLATLDSGLTLNLSFAS